MSASDPDELAAALRPLVTRLYLALRRRAPSVELTAAQSSALNVLRDHGPLRMGEFSDREAIRMPTATSVIDGLARHGLVERNPDPTDRRAVLVGLTDRGRELVTQIREERDVILTAALGRLTADDRETLSAAAPALQALRDELDNPQTSQHATADAR